MLFDSPFDPMSTTPLNGAAAAGCPGYGYWFGQGMAVAGD